MFQLICPPVFRCLLNLGTYMELWTTFSLESKGVACSDFVNHNKCWVFLYCYSPGVRIEPAASRWLSPYTCTWLWLTELQQATPPHGFNKGHSSKFHVGSWVWQTPEESWRTYRLKWGNNYKDEDNSAKTLNDKNHQASSQKFRQQTPEGRRTYRPKCCGNSNKDEDKNLFNDKNHQASSKKFRQLMNDQFITWLK